jgi:hypothetical protein
MRDLYCDENVSVDPDLYQNFVKVFKVRIGAYHGSCINSPTVPFHC